MTRAPVPGDDFILAPFLAPRRLIVWAVGVIGAAVVAWENAHDWEEADDE